MRPQRSRRAWRTAWWSTARSRRASSAASARARGSTTVSGDQALSVPYGQMSPAQWYAPKVIRFMHEHKIGQEALRAIAMASYHHAQANPRAVMHGRPLDRAVV